MCFVAGLFGITGAAGNLFNASLALSAVTQVAGAASKNRVARQTASYAYSAAERTARSADAALTAQQEALNSQLLERRADAAQKKLAKTIEGLQARGLTIASEQAGLTVGYLLRDAERQSANARESINQALESATKQYRRNVDGLVAQRDNRRNELQSNINQAYNQIPSLGSVLLNVATSGLNSYTSIASLA